MQFFDVGLQTAQCLAQLFDFRAQPAQLRPRCWSVRFPLEAPGHFLALPAQSFGRVLHPGRVQVFDGYRQVLHAPLGVDALWRGPAFAVELGPGSGGSGAGASPFGESFELPFEVPDSFLELDGMLFAEFVQRPFPPGRPLPEERFRRGRPAGEWPDLPLGSLGLGFAFGGEIPTPFLGLGWPALGAQFLSAGLDPLGADGSFRAGPFRRLSFRGAAFGSGFLRAPADGNAGEGQEQTKRRGGCGWWFHRLHSWCYFRRKRPKVNGPRARTLTGHAGIRSLPQRYS